MSYGNYYEDREKDEKIRRLERDNDDLEYDKRRLEDEVQQYKRQVEELRETIRILRTEISYRSDEEY
jgi:predicted nuclease with TOPRIM domain